VFKREYISHHRVGQPVSLKWCDCTTKFAKSSPSPLHHNRLGGLVDVLRALFFACVLLQYSQIFFNHAISVTTLTVWVCRDKKRLPTSLTHTLTHLVVRSDDKTYYICFRRYVINLRFRVCRPRLWREFRLKPRASYRHSPVPSGRRSWRVVYILLYYCKLPLYGWWSIIILGKILLCLFIFRAPIILLIIIYRMHVTIMYCLS